MELSLEIVARTLFNTEVTDDIRSINDEVNTIMGLYNFIVAFPRIELLPAPAHPRHHEVPPLQSPSRRRRRSPHPRAPRSHRRGEPDKGDLLSMLLSSPRRTGRRPGQHTGMSDEQVRDEVLTIFLAGYETVANGLTWTWYLLSQNPDVEAKLHAELDAVLGTE
jgi:cytochrome P450